MCLAVKALSREGEDQATALRLSATVWETLVDDCALGAGLCLACEWALSICPYRHCFEARQGQMARARLVVKAMAREGEDRHELFKL